MNIEMMSLVEGHPDGIRDQRIERAVPLAHAGGDLRRAAAAAASRRRSCSRARGGRARSSRARTTACWSWSAPAASTTWTPRSTTPSALSAKAAELAGELCVAMRVYFEKPRTTTGWKGMINDPHLDGSGDVNAGLRRARGLLLEVLGARPAGRLRVPRPDHAAVHLRHGGLGRDRRPHHREPDPPPARLGPVDAGGLQERHRRQRRRGRRRGARRGRARTPSRASR